MHLLVNELCEYQNARCSDKNYHIMFMYIEYIEMKQCLEYRVFVWVMRFLEGKDD